jgi:hypothetical protein
MKPLSYYTICLALGSSSQKFLFHFVFKEKLKFVVSEQTIYKELEVVVLSVKGARTLCY